MSVLPTIAISGCGAVTNQYYGPALTDRGERLGVVGIYDPDPARIEEVAPCFPHAERAGSLERLLGLSADLVVVASPPAVHAEQAIAALRAGSNVLCEKPMALTVADAEAMAEAARSNDRLLAVAMVRRWFPASRIVARLIETRSLGRVRSAQAFEGGPFRWPIRSQSYFSTAVSGGGVLADTGVHVLDLLHFWLGEPRLVRAADDAMGGVEANALIDVRCGDVPASIRLSRDWERPNRIELRLDHGWIRWRAGDPAGVELGFDGDPDPLRIAEAGGRPVEFLDCFGSQLDAVLDRLAGRRSPVVTAEDALPVVDVMEQAYRDRVRLAMPWLEPFVRGAPHAV